MQDDITSILQHFIDYFSLFSYIQNATYDSYLLGFYAIIIFILIVFVNEIYIIYADAYKFYNKANIICQKYVFHLMSTVLFLPIFQYLAQILSCSNSHLTYYSEVACWRGMHGFHAFTGICTMLVFGSWVLLIV